MGVSGLAATDARYQPGDSVRVRAHRPPGHHRTPEYIKGKKGRVSECCGIFPNPESLAHGGLGLPGQPLYRVAFDQTDVWGSYAGPSIDKVYVDIYHHWLEAD